VDNGYTNVTATYVNGGLVGTSTTFGATVNCNAPLYAINSQATLWKNNLPLGVSDTWVCLNCDYAIPTDFAACSTGPSCAGYYHPSHRFSLWLPAGYTWNAPGPGCTVTPDRKILACTWHNPNAVYVPLFD